MKTRRRVVRPRRKTTWLAGANSGCGTRLTVTPCDFEGVDAVDPDLFLIVDNPEDALPGQVASVSEVTVLRVVGDLAMWSSITASAITEPQHITFSFHMGMYIADVPSASFSTQLDPTLSADASSGDWMWRSLVMHSYSAGLGATNQSQIQYASSGPTDPHIDIRVKRKLRKQESIILAVKVTTDHPFPSGTPRTLDTAFLYADLRALVALP